eukprot:m51a1_g10167 hypothetical protein (168) ;mRNA; f:86830-88310
MSLSHINAQYEGGKVTDITFSDIFGHVFEHVIGVQAVAQQYMAAKMHGHSTMFEQEVSIIHYSSGSNASYLQLDHNHCIIFILFIHVIKHYNFQLSAISDSMWAIVVFLFMSIQAISTFEVAIITNIIHIIIKLKNYIMTCKVQQAKKTNKEKPFTNGETSVSCSSC